MTEAERFEKLIKLGWTYDSMTGSIYNSRGSLCKNINKDGYIQISVLDSNKKLYNVMGHRFAYYYFYKDAPNITDHINGDRLDNSISNLRSVTHTENNRNRSNSKGYYERKDYKGVAFHAQITINGVVKYLGVFKTEIDAKSAYNEAKNKYFK
jgi:hypothetical protein